jgi:hypothetical protein
LCNRFWNFAGVDEIDQGIHRNIADLTGWHSDSGQSRVQMGGTAKVAYARD